MPRRTLTLTSDERAALEALRDHGDRAYLRERAAALLKIADGTPAAQVARSGLLRRRRCETLYTWLDRFAAEGVQGLLMRPGRGRKPAFSPPLRRSAGRAGGGAGSGAAGSAPVRP